MHGTEKTEERGLMRIWENVENVFCRTRIDGVKDWIATFGRGADDYPLATVITAVFFAFLGLTVANWGFNQCLIPCIKRHGIRTTELLLGAGLFWVVNRAFQSICSIRNESGGSPKKAPGE